jgi:hypothetical protein
LGENKESATLKNSSTQAGCRKRLRNGTLNGLAWLCQRPRLPLRFSAYGKAHPIAARRSFTSQSSEGS